jgi:hypothetical protein
VDLEVPIRRESIAADSGAKVTGLQTLPRLPGDLELRKAFGLRRVHRRFSIGSAYRDSGGFDLIAGPVPSAGADSAKTSRQFHCNRTGHHCNPGL